MEQGVNKSPMVKMCQIEVMEKPEIHLMYGQGFFFFFFPEKPCLAKVINNDIKIFRVTNLAKS